jgi:NAD(P)-dependent dehydrogenase (short-subunit alcohol dehydrogenase family)
MSTESVGAPVALVSGAAKGIGLETARRLAGAGYAVYLTARSSERGRTAAATIGAQLLELDLPSDGSVRDAAGSVEQAGSTCPVRDDPHDYTTDDMTEPVALFTRSCAALRA